jgi:hypothetical protein
MKHCICKSSCNNLINCTKLGMPDVSFPCGERECCQINIGFLFDHRIAELTSSLPSGLRCCCMGATAAGLPSLDASGGSIRLAGGEGLRDCMRTLTYGSRCSVKSFRCCCLSCWTASSRAQRSCTVSWRTRCPAASAAQSCREHTHTQSKCLSRDATRPSSA